MTDLPFDYRGARADIFRSEMPGGLKLLALALVEFMPCCRPSVMTLAAQCGVERKTVLRALARLERLGVIGIERRTGQRSQYVLQPVPSWRTGTSKGPVPPEGTSTTPEPVPTAPGTGTNVGMGPVPMAPRTSPTAVGHEAVQADPESGVKRTRPREAEGFAAVARTVTMPGPDPTKSYLAACVMAGVKPMQAVSTWNHYYGQGLPPGGVERLEPWLVQRAKEKQTASTQLPPARPGDDIDTTGAATVFRPNSDHIDFVKKYLPQQDLLALAQQCRQVPRFVKLDTLTKDREFMARLRCLHATGMFFPDGPLPRMKKEDASVKGPEA